VTVGCVHKDVDAKHVHILARVGLGMRPFTLGTSRNLWGPLGTSGESNDIVHQNHKTKKHNTGLVMPFFSAPSISLLGRNYHRMTMY